MRLTPLTALVVLAAAALCSLASAADAQLIVDIAKPGPVINKNIYG